MTTAYPIVSELTGPNRREAQLQAVLDRLIGAGVPLGNLLRHGEAALARAGRAVTACDLAALVEGLSQEQSRRLLREYERMEGRRRERN